MADSVTSDLGPRSQWWLDFQRAVNERELPFSAPDLPRSEVQTVTDRSSDSLTGPDVGPHDPQGRPYDVADARITHNGETFTLGHEAGRALDLLLVSGDQNAILAFFRDLTGLGEDLSFVSIERNPETGDYTIKFTVKTFEFGFDGTHYIDESEVIYEVDFNYFLLPAVETPAPGPTGPAVTINGEAVTLNLNGATFTEAELEALGAFDWTSANTATARFYIDDVRAVLGDALTDKLLGIEVVHADGSSDSLFGTLFAAHNGGYHSQGGWLHLDGVALAADLETVVVALGAPADGTTTGGLTSEEIEEIKDAIEAMIDDIHDAQGPQVDGNVAGDTPEVLHADARQEAVFALAETLLTVTGGEIPANWTTEQHVAFVFGNAGLGSLVGTDAWNEFVLQLADPNALQHPEDLDYSMFNEYFEGGVAPNLGNLVAEGVILERFFVAYKPDVTDDVPDVLDHATFGEIYYDLTLPEPRRRLAGGTIGAITYTGYYATISGSATAGTATTAAVGAAAIGAIAAAAVVVGVVAIVGYRIYATYQDYQNIIDAGVPETVVQKPDNSKADYVGVQLSLELQVLLDAGNVTGAVDLLLQAEKEGVSRGSLQFAIDTLPDAQSTQLMTAVYQRVAGETGQPTDYFQALVDGRDYSFVEDYAYQRSPGQRGALDGFFYVENNDPSSQGYALTTKGAAERLQGIDPEVAGVVLDLWLADLSGKPASDADYRFFNFTLENFAAGDPSQFGKAMTELYQRDPQAFEQAVTALGERGDYTLIGKMIDALPVADQFSLFVDLTGITDPAALDAFLVNGNSRVFGAISSQSRGEIVAYLRGGLATPATLESARVNEYDYYPPADTQEVEITPGVWVPAPTELRGGVDVILAYVDGTADVPAGTYAIGLVEQDGLKSYRLIDQSGHIVHGYSVTPPAPDSATGNWQVEPVTHGRELFTFSHMARRIAFRTRPLRLLNLNGGAPAAGGYGGVSGSIYPQWQDRFVTQRPLTNGQQDFANDTGQPLPTLATLGEAGQNLQTTESLAILIGLAPNEVTADVQADLEQLDTEAEREAKFRAMFTGENFNIDIILNGVTGTGNGDPLFRNGVDFWMADGVLDPAFVSGGYITQAQQDEYQDQVAVMKETFESGDIFGGFVMFARLVVEGNKLKLAKQYAKEHNVSPEEAMAAVQQIFAPYDALSDSELVAMSLYTGLDQGSWTGAGTTGNGYFYEALNTTLTDGTTSDRLELAPFAAVLHQGLEQLALTTDETWDQLDDATGGAYGDANAVTNSELGPVPQLTRGLNIQDPEVLARLNGLEAGDAWGGDHRFSSSTAGTQLAKPWASSNVVVQIQSDHIAILSPLAMSGQFLREVVVSPGYTLVLAEDPYVNADGQLVITLTTAPISVTGGEAGLPAPTPTPPESSPVGSLVDFVLESMPYFDNAGDLLPTDSQGYYASGVAAGTLLNNIYGGAQADPEFSEAFRNYVLSLSSEDQQDLLAAVSTGPYRASPEAVRYLEDIIASGPSGGGNGNNPGNGTDTGGDDDLKPPGIDIPYPFPDLPDTTLPFFGSSGT